MSSYGYAGYGYAAYGNGYGYGGGAAYEIFPGGLNPPVIYLSGPGSNGYYSYYSGATKYIDSAYENYYGGKTTYAATLSPTGNFTETSYSYRSSQVAISFIDTYISHNQLNSASYYGYEYGHHAVSVENSSISATTYFDGATGYATDISSSSLSYFDGSYKNSYSVTTMTEYNNHDVAGSMHTYSYNSYTDSSGYTTYHTSQT